MSNPNTNMRDSQQNCVRETPRFHDSQQSCVHGIPRFHDYSVRIWNDEDGNLVGTYINADFNTGNSDEPYHGISALAEQTATRSIFYHMSDDHLSIELGTHDEQLIFNAISLCKEISNNFLMLDELLTIINTDNNLNKELLS